MILVICPNLIKILWSFSRIMISYIILLSQMHQAWLFLMIKCLCFTCLVIFNKTILRIWLLIPCFCCPKIVKLDLFILRLFVFLNFLISKWSNRIKYWSTYFAKSSCNFTKFLFVRAFVQFSIFAEISIYEFWKSYENIK